MTPDTTPTPTAMLDSGTSDITEPAQGNRADPFSLLSGPRSAIALRMKAVMREDGIKFCDAVEAMIGEGVPFRSDDTARAIAGFLVVAPLWENKPVCGQQFELICSVLGRLLKLNPEVVCQGIWQGKEKGILKESFTEPCGLFPSRVGLALMGRTPHVVQDMSDGPEKSDSR